MKNPKVEDNIRVSWAINNAVQEVGALSATSSFTGSFSRDLIKTEARKYLEIFDEMVKELPEEVCESCGGVSVYGGEKVVNGLHPNCKTQEGYKSKE